MKLDKLELSALLGIQARNRELVFMMEQVKANLAQLTKEAEELFSDVEMRLKMEPGTLTNYDVDITTGEIIVRREDTTSLNAVSIATTGQKDFEHTITELEEID